MDKSQDRELNSLQYVWPRAAVLQVIQLWKENECLYNPKHHLYHSKRGRSNALVKMTSVLRKYYPEITPSEVKNKLTYLRGQYSRELCRIKENSGRAEVDAYVPAAFWYSDMEFLEKFMKKTKRLTNSNHAQRADDDSCESLQRNECDESLLQDCKRSRLGSYTPVSSRSMSQENPLLLPRISAPLHKVPMSHSINGENVISERDEAFCNYIRMELNEIKNKNIKDELIEKIMFAVLDAKKEQKLYNNDLEKCFEDV